MSIGNHTFTHPMLIFKSATQVESAARRSAQGSDRRGGRDTPIFFVHHLAGGGLRVLRIARQMGLEPIMWNVTGYDWNAPSAEYIERKVTGKVRGGDVILLHDGGHRGFGADRSQTVRLRIA